MQIGLPQDVKLPNLMLGSFELKWVNELKYLGGMHFCARKKFSVDVNSIVGKF